MRLASKIINCKAFHKFLWQQLLIHAGLVFSYGTSLVIANRSVMGVASIVIILLSLANFSELCFGLSKCERV